MDLKIRIGKVRFDNPIWSASGTFGYGEEFKDFIDLDKVGAIVAKTVTLHERSGNPVPRVVETPSGLLNSIGLENKGVESFKRDAMPFLKKTKAKAIVSIAGATKDEFVQCAKALSGKYKPDAIEINLSCPNVSHRGGKHPLFAQDPVATKDIVSSVKRKTNAMLIVKLTPSVTDIASVAQAARKGGADAVALVNTYPAMAVDAEEMRPLLGNITGGLSGPAIKPMALKAVWDVYNKVDIPIIGIGGIMTGTDVAEFMLCGASAVQVGTANFVDPASQSRILKEFIAYLRKKKLNKASDLIGKLKT